MISVSPTSRSGRLADPENFLFQSAFSNLLRHARTALKGNRGFEAQLQGDRLMRILNSQETQIQF